MKRHKRTIRKIDGIEQVFYLISKGEYENIDEHWKLERKKIVTLTSKLNYYRRKISGKIKQVDRLIEQIEMQL